MDGTIAQILNNKGREFIAVDNTASLFSCALEMQQQGVGSLLVFEDQKLVGILHERDISRRAVCAQYDLNEMDVTAVMKTDFPTVTEQTSIMQAMAIISDERTRHLPVMNEDKVVGLVSIGDLTKWVLDLKESDIHHLISYINGDLAG